MSDLFDSLEPDDAPQEKPARILTPQQFFRRLQSLCTKPISLKFNENESTLLSVRPRGVGEPVSVSLHKMFLEADDTVIKALAQYVKRTTPACRQVIRTFINDHPAPESGNAKPRPPRFPLRSKGAIYDLHQLASDINRQYFENKLDYSITWSRGAVEPAGRRRHIVFGSYDARHKLIRIHPALDDSKVPAFFVQFVIYHEMLHALLDPPSQPGARRCVHSRQFREWEKRFSLYEKALKWETAFMMNGGRPPAVTA